ncbi:MAG: hypothetical protein IKT00_14010 [Prevotella sp.]|nr:hypothetical protein [Prevotella sp.]
MKKIFNFLFALMALVLAQEVQAAVSSEGENTISYSIDNETYVQAGGEGPSVKFRFRVEAGVAFSALGLTTDPNDPAITKEKTINFSTLEPSFGLGAEMELLRNPDISFMGMLNFGYQSYSKDNQEVKYGQLQVRLGTTYIFDRAKKYSPFVYGGVNGNYLVGFDSKNIGAEYWIGKPSFDKKSSDMLGFGLFLGGGENMDLDGHDLRLSLEYGFNAIPPLEIQVHSIGLKAAYVF